VEIRDLPPARPATGPRAKLDAPRMAARFEERDGRGSTKYFFKDHTPVGKMRALKDRFQPLDGRHWKNKKILLATGRGNFGKQFFAH